MQTKNYGDRKNKRHTNRQRRFCPFYSLSPQKQRIALARAIAGKPDILILDDITSRLDTETETALWKILNEKFPFITMVNISHKIASLVHSDEIVVFEKGEIIARGSHNELVNTHGIYQDVYKFQMF